MQNLKWIDLKIAESDWLDPFTEFSSTQEFNTEDPKQIPDLSWSPFTLAESGKRADPPRSLKGPFGVADRLRWVAFAEFQAARGFYWATLRFPEAPDDLKADWLSLAHEEAKHLNWILVRMRELGFSLSERKVNTDLWLSFIRCSSPREFSLYMANAEERGRESGELFAKTLEAVDTETANLFHQIATEEKAHVELATRHYPDFSQITSQYSLRI